MKSKILIGISLLVIGNLLYTLYSCNRENFYEKCLGGSHELRKLNVKDETSSNIRGSYFLISHVYSVDVTTKTKVTFCFKNYKDEYQFKEMDLDRVLIKTCDTLDVPYVRFYWVNRNHGENEYMKICDYDITRVVVYCKESDFPEDVNINDLK